MKPELKRADGLQHLQATATTPDTPLPAPDADVNAYVAPVVPEGLEKLYDAIHGGPVEGHMTWTK